MILTIRRFYLISLILLLFTESIYASQESYLNQPLSIGPQYIFSLMRTRFEPESAFLIPTGKSLMNFSYSNSNSFEYSQSSSKTNDFNGDPSVFTNKESNGYSVYIDGEVIEHGISFRHGLSELWEIQLSFKEVQFTGGAMDSFIEGFHSTLNLGTLGRDRTGRRKFEIYVYDNVQQKLVWQFTEPDSGSQRLAYNIGLKRQLRKTEKEAIAFKVSANFGDSLIETGLNELDSSSDYSHRNFNDYNLSLYYTSKFDSWTLHAAFSITVMEDPIFDRSPSQYMYYFIGANYHFTEGIDLIMQNLVYT
ncbi:MAG: hypothetical protein ACI86H_000820, partial [bacterium]